MKGAWTLRKRKRFRLSNLLKLHRWFLFSFWIGIYGDVTSSDQMNSQESISRLTEGSSYFFYQQPEFPRDCWEVQDQCFQQNKSGVHWIKPDGYLEPFEVFCDNMEDSLGGGWLVIQRRIDGSVKFNRSWKEYKQGFGFLSSEFWIGNDKLSYLTNQKRYELRIDMSNYEGSVFYVAYSMFRLSDEWSGYSLTKLGSYIGSADPSFEICPLNMQFGNCSCQTTCGDPQKHNGCYDENCIGGTGCFCPDGLYLKGNDCVLEDECGCFVEGKGVIQNGDTSVNSDCSSRCTCNNDVLTCEEYECSVNARCEERSDVRRCYCEEGFDGDGQTCTEVISAHDCLDVYNAGNTSSGVYRIRPSTWSGSSFEVYCDMTTAGGGWMVFQRRRDGGTNFYRNWNSYKIGFGDMTNEFWLGNDKLHAITQQKDYELRTDLTDKAGRSFYALNSLFRIDNETNNYLVTDVGSYSGSASANRIGELHNIPFSTHDNDNEESSYNCAEKHGGGWWYGYAGHLDGSTNYCFNWRDGTTYYWCTASNLNGDYNGGDAKNIFWVNLGGYVSPGYCNIKVTEMKIRPV